MCLIQGVATEEKRGDDKMFGPIIATGFGALTFKLGMEAHRMKADGKSTPEIITSMPAEAYNTVASATKWCYETIRGMTSAKKRRR